MQCYVAAWKRCHSAGGNRYVYRQTEKDSDVCGGPETDQQGQSDCAEYRQKSVRHNFRYPGGSGRGICGKGTDVNGHKGLFFDEMNEKK